MGSLGSWFADAELPLILLGAGPVVSWCSFEFASEICGVCGLESGSTIVEEAERLVARLGVGDWTSSGDISLGSIGAEI